ncbi:hypothetical protein MEQU1_002847 [Malassezia equina]|uniref:Uncharacterized protein n=1 Tax=Malassezia equina TaxID=1381935 RepID=A0AAF0EEF4_9BASI|nr:hypothetical protein MEQU1_002847 [Malassezia equina]
MEWDDGSSLDPAKLSDTTDMDELDQDRPEPYLLAGDEDPDLATVERDDQGTSYVLPFSRVYMADLFDIVMTPHLAVYHLPTRMFLDKHVRLSRISSSRYEATMATWLQGEPSPSFNFWDMVSIAPWSFVMVFLALAYFLLVHLGGEQYHIQHIMARFS